MSTKKQTLHPIDKEILRFLSKADFKITPSEIANLIGIHPVTAKKHIVVLKRRKLVRCTGKGNRTYCHPLSQAQINRIRKIYG